MIWYGFCTFWTDDWGQLSDAGDKEKDLEVLHCCPSCNSGGFETTEDEWWEGVQRVEEDTPGYYKFIRGLKERCHGKGTSIGDLWELRKKELAK